MEIISTSKVYEFLTTASLEHMFLISLAIFVKIIRRMITIIHRVLKSSIKEKVSHNIHHCKWIASLLMIILYFSYDQPRARKISDNNF